MWFALGLLLLLLGAAVVVIPLLATTLGEALPLAAVGLVVAVLPGALMLRVALRNLDEHPLVVALEQHPERVANISFGYLQRLGGYAKQANVTVDGRAWSFPVGLDGA